MMLQTARWLGVTFFLPFYSRGFLTTRSIFACQHSCYPSRSTIVRVQIRVQWVKLLRTVVKLRRYIICGYSWCATVCRAAFVAGLSPGSRSIFVYALYSFNNLASFYDRCNVHVRLRHPLALPLSLSPHRHPFCIFPPSSLFYPLLW